MTYLCFRDGKQRGASGDVPLLYPQREGFMPAWDNASPELSSILENLKKTEQHLQGKSAMSNTLNSPFILMVLC